MFSSRHFPTTLLILAGLLGGTGEFAFAQSPADDAGIEFYEKKIRPVFVEHCHQCHAADSKILRGGLQVDSRMALMEGGDSGPAIVPGDPDESLLIQALRYESYEMPPKQKLADDVIADFVKWIEMGAPAPTGEAIANAGQEGMTIESGREFWAFQPPKSHPVPDAEPADWPRCDIDRFVLAKQNEAGLGPGPDADKRTLLRRVTYDLIGLPPTPQELADFLADDSPEAFETVVDRLLASPRFGERWGRYWLDLARYADSTGGGRSLLYDISWRYRDYVIDSFNADKPFDQFLMEQLAGDLMPAESLEEAGEQLTATGFLALGPTNYEDQDKKKLRMDVVDEQIDTTGRVFMAMTIGCARCHDHKFDPIPTKDYYALAGIFRSTQTLIHSNVSNWVERSLPVSDAEQKLLDEHDAAVAAIKAKVKEAEKRLAALKDELKRENQVAELSRIAEAGQKQRRNYEKAVDQRAQRLAGKAIEEEPGAPEATEESADGANRVVRVADQLKATETVLEELKAELKTCEKNGPPKPPMVICVQEEKQPEDYFVGIRGSVHHLGEQVSRGFLTVAYTSDDPEIGDQESGRLQLAEWIASPDNPLTARVFVNRVWSKLFGTGIVRTVDNFGFAGERPSHPELLDHLALEFQADGWSVKNLIRSIVLSRAYQLSSERAPSESADPENRLLTHQNRRRLDAESLHDTMLFVSGELTFEMGGRTMREGAQEYGYTFDYGRRAIYLPVLRNQLPELFAVFDFPDPNLSVGRRTTSTLSTQALFMLNSPFVMDRANALAARSLEQEMSDDDRLAWLTETCFAREPLPDEQRLVDSFLKETGDLPQQARWSQIAQAMLGSLSLRYLE